MDDHLDDLERVLAELSPKVMKLSPRSPITFGSPSPPESTAGSVPLGLNLVADMPGYSGNTEDERRAPRSPAEASMNAPEGTATPTKWTSMPLAIMESTQLLTNSEEDSKTIGSIPNSPMRTTRSSSLTAMNSPSASRSVSPPPPVPMDASRPPATHDSPSPSAKVMEDSRPDSTATDGTSLAYLGSEAEESVPTLHLPPRTGASFSSLRMVKPWANRPNPPSNLASTSSPSIHTKSPSGASQNSANSNADSDGNRSVTGFSLKFWGRKSEEREELLATAMSAEDSSQKSPRKAFLGLGGRLLSPTSTNAVRSDSTISPKTAEAIPLPASPIIPEATINGESSSESMASPSVPLTADVAQTPLSSPSAVKMAPSMKVSGSHSTPAVLPMHREMLQSGRSTPSTPMNNGIRNARTPGSAQRDLTALLDQMESYVDEPPNHLNGLGLDGLKEFAN